jgi:trimethylamine-N-oxide reductase (cytochrome c)
VQTKYGFNAVLLQGDGHGECKTIHTPHGQPGPLLDHMGGFTLQVRNPDSWEGWYWGAKHVWGQGTQGMYSPAHNLVKDSTENSEMVLFWGQAAPHQGRGNRKDVQRPRRGLVRSDGN